MRQCDTCKRYDLPDSDEKCPSCHAPTTTVGWSSAELIGALVLGGLALLASRSKRALSNAAPENFERVWRANEAIRDAQVRTWAAQQWSNIYR